MVSLVQLLLLLGLGGSVSPTALDEDDPHEWLAQRSCSFRQWPPQDRGSSWSQLTPAQFHDEGMARAPLLLRMPTNAADVAANWSATFDRIAGEGRVRSLRAAHHRSEGGLYRYLKKFESESSLGDFLDRVAAARTVRNGPMKDSDQATSHTEYVFMQTDFTSDGLGALLPMVSPPTFLLESTNQQDMYFILGDKGTGLAFHDHGAAWVTAVSGRKHWLVFDPQYFKRMEDEVREFELPRLRGDFKPGDRMDAARLRRMLVGPVDGGIIDDEAPVGFATKGWECVQEPGTTVYVPPGWFHAVTNLDDGIVGYGGQPLGTERRTELRIKSRLADHDRAGFMFPKHFANSTEQMEKLHMDSHGGSTDKPDL